MNKAIFLDRDGVINQTIFRDGKARAPYTKEDFALFAGVREAIVAFKQAGFLTVIITNQPDVARGWVEEESVHMINSMICDLVPIDKIKICFHTEKDNCSCRKPKPGMLLEAAHELGIDLSQSFMIGDRYSDIEAGQAAGCKSLLIGDGYKEEATIQPLHQFSSLEKAAGWILKNEDL